ncbi:hypothetical protein [Lysinibacillus sp. fls2-241-R2A-57]|uniref:hypothetical protein n=1 Tax=Lysinibacillus sp. fls2-241-R2A-57 TaxID=3040292 RepID=UPI002553D970|nr:hypothetical protein [Lysinibacillus sp. fls2-241-R2A-57]
MFYLRENEVSAATPAEEAARRSPAGSIALRESEASANVLSVRKRSDSNNKAPSRNGNQPHVMVMSHKNG